LLEARLPGYEWQPHSRLLTPTQVADLNKRGLPPAVGEHLLSAGRPQSVNTKLRWASPF
jgi:hypothetical protein